MRLRQYTLSDSCFRLRNLDRNRRRSIGWAFDRYAKRELRMEHRSQSKDRWQNGRQRRSGATLRPLCAARAPCINGLGRAKYILLCTDINCAERPFRTDLRIHGVMGRLESRGSNPISPASGTIVLIRDSGFQSCYLADGRVEALAIDDLWRYLCRLWKKASETNSREL